MTTRNPNPLWRRTSRWRNGLLGIAAALFMAPAAFAQCGVGESELSLTTSGGSYASEKWVNITTGANGTGTVIWAQGNGTYGNGAGLVTGVTFCVTNGSTYYINCYDTYADGWDGTVYSITAGPTVVANNGGVSPDDGTDTDASYLWNNPPPSTVELESSEAFSYTPPACPPPSSLGVTALNASGADLGWTESGTATAWDLEIGAGGFSPTGTPMFNDVGANPYTWAGGSANMPYDFYVRADCGMDNVDVSGWSGPYSFFTGYCVSTSSGSASYISDFTTTGGLTNIANPSGNWSPTGYGDFTAQSASQSANGVVNYTAAFVGTTVGFNLWVDWNNDLDFDDPGEDMHVPSGYVSSVSSSFTVPALTPVGNYRMRIRCDWNATNPAACGTASRAETEDYTFTVAPPPACPPPTAQTATSITTSGADLGWTENGSATAWDIEIGVAPLSATGVPTLNDVGTNPYTWSGGAAATTYEFYVRADCNSDDIDVSAWVGPFSFTTTCAALPVPYTQDFESTTGTDLPICWSKEDLNGGTTWNSYATGVLGGSRVARYLYNTPLGADDWLYSAGLALTASTSYTVEYTFKGSGPTYLEDMDVYWGPAATSASMTNFIADHTGIDGTVSTVSYSFTPLSTGTYYIGWHAKSIPDRNYLYLDDISVIVTPACPAPTALGATNETGVGADLGWTENGTATAWDLEIGADGFTPSGTPTHNDVGANPYTWAGGAPTTDYDFYVRADCGMDNVDVSSWAGPFSFTTGCATYTPDYTENFGTYVPNCWEEATGPISGPTTFGSSGWKFWFVRVCWLC